MATHAGRFPAMAVKLKGVMAYTKPSNGRYSRRFQTDESDFGSHTVCAVVSAEFLEHQKSVGNDLSTPAPQFGFAGLKPGDRWAVCAPRWQQALEDGAACGVVLAATNEAALEYINSEDLIAHSVDVPPDLSELT